MLNGSKAFISGGGFSDLYVVMARTGGDGPKGISAILVEAGTPGLSFGAPERKMGWKAQPTAQVQFDDCRVPAANLLGEEGAGFSYAMQGLDGGRLNIAAAALGGAQAALDIALAYTAERRAFGQPLNEFQALQFRLADMETELQAARVFLYQAAWKLRPGRARRDQALRDGQALRHRHRLQGRERRAAAARRLRLPRRLRHREDRARPARAPDPRRHQRDHAGDRRARPAGGAA